MQHFYLFSLNRLSPLGCSYSELSPWTYSITPWARD